MYFPIPADPYNCLTKLIAADANFLPLQNAHEQQFLDKDEIINPVAKVRDHISEHFGVWQSEY